MEYVNNPYRAILKSIHDADRTPATDRTLSEESGIACERSSQKQRTISTEEGMIQLLQGTEKLLREYNSADHTAEYEHGWFAAFFGVQDIIHDILCGEMKRIEEMIESLSDSSILDDDESDDDWSDDNDWSDDDDWDNDDFDDWDEDWDDDFDEEFVDDTPYEPCPENDSAVNHPSHYNTGKIEVIDFLEDQKLSFHLGNAVKYICRAGKKNPNKTVEDLEKAVWYLNRYIGLLCETDKKRSADKYITTGGETQ